MRIIAAALSVAAVWMAASAGLAEAQAPEAALTPIGSFQRPVHIASAPGRPDLLFVVERSGRVQVMRDGVVQPQPFLEIPGRVRSTPDDLGASAEQGLVSIAFPPDYADSGLFYVYYTTNFGDIEIDEFKRRADNPLRADHTSRRKVLVIPHRDAQNHYGGQLHFRAGGLLYFATGDGGSTTPRGKNAPHLGSLLGKLLRIDPTAHLGAPYRVPASNPYVGIPGRDEIIAYGLRNPWRFSFDGVRIAIGDVGQDFWEEVDFLPLGDAIGANFGWPEYEGFALFDPTLPGADPVTFPTHVYSHDAGCSITGGYVVRDTRLATLSGRYLYIDFCAGELRRFTPVAQPDGSYAAVNDGPVGVSLSQPSSFGVDADGRIYLAQLSAPGTVYRLDPVTP